jgi:hypothetical protein
MAIAAGVGLAVGMCAAASIRRNPGRKSETPPDEVLRLEPLLDRVERLERRPEAEIELSERVAALEHALAEHSASIEVMRDRATQNDACMHHLSASIDRLSDRWRPPASRPPQSSQATVLLPFEKQMSEVVHRQITEEPRVRVIKENSPKRNDFLWSRIFPLLLFAFLPRF